MIDVERWVTGYLAGKQIPKSCNAELIITMTERCLDYCKVAISWGPSVWKYEKFFGDSNIDAYFTVLLDGYTVKNSKYYVAIDSNVWSCLKMAKKVLLKGQLRNRFIIDIIKIDGL